MKRPIKLLILFCAITALSFIPPKNNIVGHWGIPGNKEFVNFNKEGTYEVYLENGTIGERGYYKIDHSVFSIKNAVARACGDGYWGTYRIKFYGSDSVHFDVIEDSCSARRMDNVGYNPGLRRLKSR